MSQTYQIEPDMLLALQADVLIRARTDLDANSQARVAGAAGEYVISRRRGRQRASMISAASADLLEHFRIPHSIPEAAFLHGVKQRRDPRAVLEEALPMLERSIREGWLVDPDQLEDPTDQPTLTPGDDIDGHLVTRRLRFLDDTEIYQVRLDSETASEPVFALLKLFRQRNARRLCERETAILEHLDGEPAPRLLKRGEIDGDPYLLLEWCEGVNAMKAAEEYRELGMSGRAGLLELCRAITEVYAELHARGVLHGDVHSDNLLIQSRDAIRLVDFGLSRFSDDGAVSRPGIRGGLAFYLEPEAARQILEDGTSPPASALSEQYALAALLYRLVTGIYTHDFTLEHQAMLHQIAEEAPLPFTARGMRPWPELEAVLWRALDKDPARRFGSIDELAGALAELDSPAPAVVNVHLGDTLTRRAAEVLEQTTIDGPWAAELPAPTASVKFGAAGIACALLRIAGQREDPELLSRAGWWVHRAERSIQTVPATSQEEPRTSQSDPAFYRPEVGLKRETIGAITPYHTASGVHAVSGLVAGAIGNYAAYARSARAFAMASETENVSTSDTGDPLDLALGPSGNLLAAALLSDVGLLGAHKEELWIRGHGLLRDIWNQLDERPLLTPTTEQRLGIAHGWAGAIYAALQWHRTSGAELPGTVEERLSQLADLAEPKGRGRRWRWGGVEQAKTMSGWCNGSTGYVFLWSLAGRVLDDQRYFDLALAAGWDVWDDPSPTAHLCCGLAGRAYALLHLATHSGDHRWLQRARRLARRAAESEKGFDQRFPHSLYKGELILAVLAADLERPQDATFPFFEEEGWDRPPGW